LEAAPLAILVLAAFLTSILSAVIGLAGGMILLVVMLLFIEPLVAIPLHGAVQLVSNGSRAWFQRVHVERPIIWRYSALLVPGGVVGLLFVQQLAPEMMRVLIGVFVLVATWVPHWLTFGARPQRGDSQRRFVWLGGMIGFLNMSIGATGPLAAPFFLGLGLSRQGLVGTSAACMTVGHLVKITLFALGGFAFAPWLGPLALLAAAVVAGTWVGTQLLDRVSERIFVPVFKTLLTLIALRLLLPEMAAALGTR
jgi:uncharacterized membrane protein YfcA